MEKRIERMKGVDNMKNKRIERIVVIGLLVVLLANVLVVLLPAQPAKAQTQEELMNAVKQAYPVLMNPSFETGNVTGWEDANSPVRPAQVIASTTPDGNFFVRVWQGITSGNAIGCLGLTSPLVLKSEQFRFYTQRHGTYSWGYDHYVQVSMFGASRDQLYSITYPLTTTTMSVEGTWVLFEKNLKEDSNATGQIANWANAKYVTMKLYSYYNAGPYGAYPGYSYDFDGIYLGDYHNETNMFTINPCDVQTVQSQNEYISLWAANSFGVAINNIKITVENLALKSLAVNCISISGNNLGYHAVGEQKYIQLGIESPATLGLYNVSVLFIYYDTYNQEIGRERFLIQVGNIAIQMNLDFSKETYEKGQQGTLRIKNNMDRAIRVYIYAWYEAQLFLYGDVAYSLGTGVEKIFTLQLLIEGKYTFEFRIYYDEVLQTRELRVQKQVYLVPANIYSNFATDIWGIKGNTTLDYSFFTNSTELGNYTLYVRMTYPSGSQAVLNKTVYSGLYEWYMPIPIPFVGYSECTFEVEVFRKNGTVDIQYGTTETYQNSTKVWEKTYTVYESAKPSAVGWTGLEQNWLWLVVSLVVIVVMIAGSVYVLKRRKKT